MGSHMQLGIRTVVDRRAIRSAKTQLASVSGGTEAPREAVSLPSSWLIEGRITLPSSWLMEGRITLTFSWLL